MFNGTSYLYKVPNLPSSTVKYPFRQLDLQISNLSTQPTHFASCQLNPPPFFHVDMFPLTANFSFFGRVTPCPKSAPPRKSLVFKPFLYIYFSTFDINTTVSTCSVNPNISTACIFFTSYPCFVKYSRSRARVSGPQEM